MQSIGGLFNSTIGGLVQLVEHIVTWLQDISFKLGNGFSNFVSSIATLKDTVISWFGNVVNTIVSLPKTILDGLSDLLNKLFNPNYDGNFSLQDLLADRFPFVNQFQSALSNINTGGTPIHFEAMWGTYKIDINGSVLEPHIPKLKSGLSILFWVMLLLSIWRMISNAFGIGVKIATGNIGGGGKDDN